MSYVFLENNSTRSEGPNIVFLLLRTNYTERKITDIKARYEPHTKIEQ